MMACRSAPASARARQPRSVTCSISLISGSVEKTECDSESDLRASAFSTRFAAVMRACTRPGGRSRARPGHGGQDGGHELAVFGVERQDFVIAIGKIIALMLANAREHRFQPGLPPDDLVDRAGRRRGLFFERGIQHRAFGPHGVLARAACRA